MTRQAKALHIQYDGTMDDIATLLEDIFDSATSHFASMINRDVQLQHLPLAAI